MAVYILVCITILRCYESKGFYMLPIFELGSKFEPQILESYEFTEAPHEKVKGAVVYTLEVGTGDTLLTVYEGLLHEVIYQNPSWFPWTRKRKLRHLFNSYSSNLSWVEFMDNGFGKVFDREDKELYALTSRAMDYTTFGTAFWHTKKH
ncbi:hypothetical protein AB4140_10860 [Shewanella sp. 10N.286.51.B2]|uniref:hypothetical protein n=1 Tax=Shewanella sp. 10N.286.51.B2 TaxID=3229707 RepID=UPI00354B170A